MVKFIDGQITDRNGKSRKIYINVNAISAYEEIEDGICIVYLIGDQDLKDKDKKIGIIVCGLSDLKNLTS